MMYPVRKLALLAAIVLASACSREKVHIPRDVIPADTMAMLIADLHITEAMLSQKYPRRDSLEIFKPAYFSALFEKYHTTEPKFRESYNFYREHPKLLESIYEEAITDLNLRSGEEE
jgi:hypothetical protein